MSTKTKTSDLFDVATNHLVTLNLPYPPSLNKYYRTYRGRLVISQEGKRYRYTVREILEPAFEEVPEFTSRLQVWMEVTLPDRRRRDLDNLNKALLDAITHSGVWEDDSLISDLRLVKAGVQKPGHIRLHIGEII